MISKNLRDKINIVSQELRLSDEDFQLVRSTKYRKILHSVVVKFTSLKAAQLNTWWWNFFTSPTCSIKPENALETLHLLFEKNENVWLIIEDDRKKREHYWLYEGTLNAIVAVLNELPFTEYYIVSKKLDWIICENHHNVLIGCGQYITEKMKEVSSAKIIQ